MTSAGDYTHCAKVVLVGNSGVGKTCLTERLAGEEDRFAGKNGDDDVHVATIGIDFKCRVKKINDECTLKTMFWDTAGQERYRSISQNFFRGAHAVAVVYDVTDAKSFLDVHKWLKDVKDVVGDDPDLILLLLGNKSDSHRKIVTRDEAEALANEKGFHLCLEVSARTGHNVEQVLNVLAEKIVESGKARQASAKKIDATDAPEKSTFDCCAIS